MSRVVTRHLVRRTARNELRHLRATQFKARVAESEGRDCEEAHELRALSLSSGTPLHVGPERRRMYRWAVLAS